jgi:hypothetical protein
MSGRKEGSVLYEVTLHRLRVYGLGQVGGLEEDGG